MGGRRRRPVGSALTERRPRRVEKPRPEQREKRRGSPEPREQGAREQRGEVEPEGQLDPCIEPEARPVVNDLWSRLPRLLASAGFISYE